METKALAQIIVVVNWVFFGFFATFFIAYFLICFIHFDDVANFVVNALKEQYEAEEGNYSDEELKKTAQIAIFLFGFIGLVCLIVELCLNILLMKGVKQSKKTYCNVWLIINFVFFVLSCLALITSLFEIKNFETEEIEGLIFELIYLIWTGYSLWVIKKLRDEFARNETANAGFAYYRA